MVGKDRGSIIIGGPGPDVPEFEYLIKMSRLKMFVQRLDPDEINNPNELVSTIEGSKGIRAKQLAIIVRAAGDIQGEPGFYPAIKTSNLRAALMRDIGILKIGIPGEIGFDERETPLGGFEIRLPDGTGNNVWKNPNATQLTFYDKTGRPVRGININKINSWQEIKLFMQTYKHAASEIIRFASSKNEYYKPTLWY